MTITKRLRYIGGLILLLAVVDLGYHAFAATWISLGDRRAPRDPQTGILRGAEERTLGPEDAPNAILLVHGFIGGSNNFNDLPERLAAHGWYVRVMRLPGHGTSPKDSKHTTPDELYEAVLSEIRTLQASHKHVMLIGHSMGGALCALAASETDVAGLVLAAPYFSITSRWYYGLKPETWVKVLGPVVQWIPRGSIFTQVNRKEARKQIFCYRWFHINSVRTLLAIGRRVREPAVLEHITCPVLLLHSHGDVAASPDAAEQAFNAIASTDKTIRWVDQSNHHIFWDYDREQVMEDIVQFAERILPESE